VDRQALDVHAEDVARVLADLVAALGNLDAAELAATADLHLRLDDAGVADGVSSVDRLVHGRGRAALRDGDPVSGEQLLSLVLE
jgi:hypothetical protein